MVSNNELQDRVATLQERFNQLIGRLQDSNLTQKTQFEDLEVYNIEESAEPEEDVEDLEKDLDL